jgi:hypothetical protein
LDLSSKKLCFRKESKEKKGVIGGSAVQIKYQFNFVERREKKNLQIEGFTDVLFALGFWGT